MEGVGTVDVQVDEIGHLFPKSERIVKKKRKKSEKKVKKMETVMRLLNYM